MPSEKEIEDVLGKVKKFFRKAAGTGKPLTGKKEDKVKDKKKDQKKVPPPEKEPTPGQLARDMADIKAGMIKLTQAVAIQQATIQALQRSPSNETKTSTEGGGDGKEQQEVVDEEELRRLQEEQDQHIKEAQENVPADAPNWFKYGLVPVIEIIKSVSPVVVKAMGGAEGGAKSPFDVAKDAVKESVGFVNETLKTIDTIRGAGVRDLFTTLKEAPKEYKERFFGYMLGSPPGEEHVER